MPLNLSKGDIIMKSILVTGGAGFIGSNFVAMFMRRHRITDVHVIDALTYAGSPNNLPPWVLKHPRFHLHYGNICNADLVSSVMDKVDTVIHFAAESHVARSIYDNRIFYETDVMGTHVIANQVLKHRNQIKRFVHISTSEVYGTAVSKPMAEGHPLNPMSPYASAKCGADRLVYSYWRTYDIPAVIIRPFNQYGPRQHLEKCVPRFITNAIEGNPIIVHGDGTASRDWVFVEDTCKALISVLEVPLDDILGETINLGTGKATNVSTIARKILDRLTDSSSQIEHTRNRPGQVDLHISSTEKAQRLLGWHATTRLDDGLARTVEWYRRNKHWWRQLEWMKHVPINLPDGEVVVH